MAKAKSKKKKDAPKVYQVSNVELLFEDLTEPYKDKYGVVVKLAEDNPGHQKFMEMVQEMWENHIEEHKDPDKPKLENPPFSIDKDRDGQKTGKKLMKLRTGYKPRIYDSKMHDITSDAPELTMGSLINVSFTIYPYEAPQSMGLAYRLRQVQVVELRDITDSIPANPDFTPLEDGYTIDPEETEDTDFDEKKFF